MGDGSKSNCNCNCKCNSKGNGKGKGKGKGRFPAGMTDRKARAGAMRLVVLSGAVERQMRHWWHGK